MPPLVWEEGAEGKVYLALHIALIRRSVLVVVPAKEVAEFLS
jgi:hypothetical protein